MALDGQTKWYLEQIDLSIECPECRELNIVSFDRELGSFTSPCEDCGYVVTAVVAE